MTRPQKKFGRLFLSFSPKNWMINSTHGAFRGVFEICGLIRKFWKTPVLACNQLSNRSGTQAGGKVFQKMRINPQMLKTLVFLCKGSAHYIQMSELKCGLLLVKIRKSRKVTEVWKKCLPNGPKMNFRTRNNFFLHPDMWAKCFLQKTALNLVKYGLQRLNYDLPLHIGGRHSVLYFIIPATEKYSTAMY